MKNETIIGEITSVFAKSIVRKNKKIQFYPHKCSCLKIKDKPKNLSFSLSIQLNFLLQSSPPAPPPPGRYPQWGRHVPVRPQEGVRGSDRTL